MDLVDTHCHLDFDQYDDDRDEVIATCEERMVAVINSGTNVERNQASLDLARAHDFIYATLGLHPTYIKEIDADNLAAVVEQVKKHQDEILAVGEIGLDYHHIREQEWRERQEDIFTSMLQVAEELTLPVVLHTRDAESRALELVDRYSLPGVVLHCFNGHPDLVQDAIDNGYTVSVSTQVLYSNRVQEIAAMVPLEQMTLETDAPFLYQGERNVPWHVAESAEQVAAIKDVSPETVAQQTTATARNTFGF